MEIFLINISIGTLVSVKSNRLGLILVAHERWVEPYSTKPFIALNDNLK